VAHLIGYIWSKVPSVGVGVSAFDLGVIMQFLKCDAYIRRTFIKRSDYCTSFINFLRRNYFFPNFVRTVEYRKYQENIQLRKIGNLFLSLKKLIT
jgi:hypothetical protein